MDAPSSSSELHHQVSTKTKMPLATTSSFTGVAMLSPKLFQPTTPASPRSSFGAQSSANHGKSSELQFSHRAARSDISSPFVLHSETPAQAGKKNADSGTESPMAGLLSDMAPISWKDYIPEMNPEASRVTSGEQSVKFNVENKSKDYLFTFGTISEAEEPDRLPFGDGTNHKHQSKSPYGMPRTDSAQSFGSIFNLHEYIPEITKEGSNQNTDGLSFSNYISHQAQFGDFNARSRENSTQSLDAQSLGKNIDSLSLGTQSLGSSFSFGEYLPKTNQESDADNLRKQAEKFSVQNLSSDGLFFGTGTGGAKTENLPFRDYINQKDKSDKAYEIPPTNSTEKLGTGSLGLGFNFEEYFPKITQNLNTNHPGEYPEIPNVEEKRKEDLSCFGSAGEGAKMVSSFSSPVGGFAFTSKYGGSEAPKKEIKGPRRRYIKIQKKVEHKTREKKIGNSCEERKFSFEESSGFKPENIRGDASYSNLSSDNTPLFSTSIGDAKINGTNFSFSEATYLDPILLKRNSETTPFSSSFTVARPDGPSSFSGSTNSDKMTVSVSESHYGKKNMSKIGHTSFKTRNAPMQFGGPELLRSFSFPSKPCSGLGSEEINEFANIGKYGTSRSSGMDKDGEKWQARGNEVYEKGDMKSAEEFYTRGIKSLASGETYQSRNRSLVLCYSNRAAVRMSLGQLKEALSDCLAASKIDPAFPKVQLQIANCLVALGNLEEAIKQFNKCLELNNLENLDPAILTEASSGVNKAHKVLEYISLAEDLLKWNTDQVPKALDLISDALSISSHSDRLMEMKANALLKLRRYEDAIKYCKQIPNSDGNDYICKQWQLNIIAKSYFYMGKLDEALEVIKRNEQAAVDSEWYESDSSSSQTEDIEPYVNKFPEPDTSFIITLHELARLKAAGNEAFHAGRYTEAVEHYTAAIACGTESWFFTAVCLCNRAAAYQALGQILDAVADCSVAVALYPTNTKAFSRRAALYDMISDYNQAANDLRMLISLLEKQQQENQAEKPSKTNISHDLNRAHRRLLSAEESARRRIPLNLYMILGVEESSSVDDVKEAYEKAVLAHHPDEAIKSLRKNEKADHNAMWMEVTGRVRKDAEHLFNIIGKAYAILSDTSKRAQYDLDEMKMCTKKKRTTVGTPRKSAPGR